MLLSEGKTHKPLSTARRFEEGGSISRRGSGRRRRRHHRSRNSGSNVAGFDPIEGSFQYSGGYSTLFTCTMQWAVVLVPFIQDTRSLRRYLDHDDSWIPVQYKYVKRRSRFNENLLTFHCCTEPSVVVIEHTLPCTEGRELEGDCNSAMVGNNIRNVPIGDELTFITLHNSQDVVERATLARPKKLTLWICVATAHEGCPNEANNIRCLFQRTIIQGLPLTVTRPRSRGYRAIS